MSDWRIVSGAMVLLVAMACPAFAAEPASTEPARISFNRDIRPILSDNCFACHGPDKAQRTSELRLDTHAGSRVDLGGYVAIAPGKPDQSELLTRVSSAAPEQLMPPIDSGKSLTPAQIELLRRWIEQGAEWEEHWSYTPLVRPAVPEVAGTSSNHPIDRFVQSRLASQGLVPSAAADRVTLVRRLYLDLLGLPPTPEQVAEFLADARPDAYEQLVDKLLASPHFGERMAMYWLDLVRYADTTGIHGDNHRDVAPYRDYVIGAFNDNMPFNVFCIEQLAGDLLPDSTLQQKVASGYNRMNMTTTEGGAQAKEYIAKYAADRVRNVSTVWMGATMGCCECHDHKFDPYKARDFYSMAAFFADVKEEAVALPGPAFPVPTDEQAVAMTNLDAQIAALQQTLNTQTPELDAALAAWEQDARAAVARQVTFGPWHSVGPFTAENPDLAFDTAYPPEQKLDQELDLAETFQEGQLKWTEHTDWKDAEPVMLSGDNAATYVYRTLTVEEATPVTLFLGSDDGIRVWLNGQEILNKKVYRALAADQEQVTANLNAGTNRLLMKITNGIGGYGFYFRAQQATFPDPVLALLKIAPTEFNDAQRAELAAHYRGIAPLLDATRAQLKTITDQKTQLDGQILKTLVAISVEPRMMRILPRGNWLDETGEVVEPGVPEFLPPLAVKDRRANRLDLAQWMVAGENPLTARVAVNRFWKLLFGRGIAGPLDDLGSQGSWPSHLELLDWLAIEFQKNGWNVKQMMKLMVMSQTYQQTSRADEALLARDPFNIHLARQGRYRLNAEVVRDNALAISGLLVNKIGGPSVKPYQPAGYWRHLNFPIREYEADHGEALYRRGLYTYWCRTFLHPSLLAFDAPTREECTAERTRSNTPLQALVLLNDPTYVEAARVFATHVLQQGGTTNEARLQWAMRRALSREASSEELQLLGQLLEKHLQQYAADRPAAEQLLSAGESPRPPELDVAELAAWTSVTRVILNLHETITRN